MRLKIEARELLVGDHIDDEEAGCPPGEALFEVTDVTHQDGRVNVVMEGMITVGYPPAMRLVVERDMSKLPPGLYSSTFAGLDKNLNPVVDLSTLKRLK